MQSDDVVPSSAVVAPEPGGIIAGIKQSRCHQRPRSGRVRQRASISHQARHGDAVNGPLKVLSYLMDTGKRGVRIAGF
jgi:hypothetical protein